MEKHFSTSLCALVILFSLLEGTRKGETSFETGMSTHASKIDERTWNCATEKLFLNWRKIWGKICSKWTRNACDGTTRKNWSMSSLLRLLKIFRICSLLGRRLQTHLSPTELHVFQALAQTASLFSLGTLSICSCLLTSDVDEEVGVRVSSAWKKKGKRSLKLLTYYVQTVIHHRLSYTRLYIQNEVHA